MSETATYRTGSNLSEIFAGNDAAENAQPVNTSVQEPTQVVDTSAPDTPAQTPEQTPQEENQRTFVLPELDEQQQVEQKQETTQTNWKDIIKAIDKKEIAKELGFNDFALEMNEYLNNGGNAIDYLKAKSIDYNKVSDEDIVKQDLQEKYPNFTAQEINRLFSRKFGVNDEMGEDEKEDKLLELKAEAHIKRQERIAQQQNFRIPEPISINQNQDLQNSQLEQQQAVEAARKWYLEHETTKSLIESKRVTLDLGENGKFNFNVEKPELLMRAITDTDIWQKLTSNKQGEPDVAKMQKIALYAFNPEQFEADLVNYGKTLALPKLIEEGQNIRKPASVVPMDGGKVDEKQLWKTSAKSGTIGGGR